jgi:CheY-like chemotaxis protein
MLAHELRNPLGPISSAVEILRMARSAENQTEAREIIARQVTHMSRLIDDLLDVARISRGKIELRVDRCDLGAIARQTADDYLPLVTSCGLTLVRDFVDVPLPIMGDRVRLAQVIGNILHNASKFTPAGGTVTISTALDSKAGRAPVAVRETGTGLDPAALNHVFEPFNQVNASVDRGKGGLGLGLAVAQGLIRLHQGSIEARSEGMGRGTEFRFAVPLAGAPLPGKAPAIGPTAPNRQAPLKILLVEDNRDAAFTLQRLLQILGHNVEIAFDGESGLTVARHFAPQVVMSDLGLPGKIDGYLLARTLRQESLTDPPHLIALSGYGHDKAREQTREAGFDKHLIKPVDFVVLTGLLEEIASGM